MRGDPSPSLRVTNLIKVRGHIAAASGHPSAEGRQPPLLGVILSAAKNLDCYADLCNQTLVKEISDTLP